MQSTIKAAKDKGTTMTRKQSVRQAAQVDKNKNINY
jgi:hypothetical protein